MDTQYTDRCPCIVRMDCGTENVGIGAIHTAFHMQHTDSLAELSVRYGKSPANVVSTSSKDLCVHA